MRHRSLEDRNKRHPSCEGVSLTLKRQVTLQYLRGNNDDDVQPDGNICQPGKPLQRSNLPKEETQKHEDEFSNDEATGSHFHFCPWPFERGLDRCFQSTSRY